MQKVSSTRMELLARRKQIVLAERGRELLEQKRTALIRAFLRVADAVVEGADALQQAAVAARRALTIFLYRRYRESGGRSVTCGGKSEKRNCCRDNGNYSPGGEGT